MGARLRRWWWGVNKWTIPREKGLRNTSLANGLKDVSFTFLNVWKPSITFSKSKDANLNSSSIRTSSLMLVRTSGLADTRHFALH